MCKEMPVIPVNRLVDLKRIIRKNGGPRRRRGTRGSLAQKTDVYGLFTGKHRWPGQAVQDEEGKHEGAVQGGAKPSREAEEDPGGRESKLAPFKGNRGSM
jgi:hypothetical protein